MSNDDSASTDAPKGKFSPFAGCSIFIIAGVLAAGMIGFTIWTYFKVKDTIAGFTGESRQPIELVETIGKEGAQTDLKAKLVGFRHHIEAKNEAEMALNAGEMNLAIATFDILKPHRNNLTITSVSDGKIMADIAFPVKSSMGSEEMRYLNASITIIPELVEGAAFPRITEVRPNTGGEVPEQFRQFISETLLHPLREDKELGPLFQQLSSVEIKGSNLVVHTNPDYQPPTEPDEKTKQSMFERFMTGFAIMAVFFLAIVAFIIILSRRKAKQS
ncbi:MAG: hypothetical protein KJO79_03750 [Verrucomicrobiae bacterium]|nr:hypothetical protein [Verrucomicrobiae bacterium]NNJ86272.1 hypothetical protein [Akkermansiaceae bacterium]